MGIWTDAMMAAGVASAEVGSKNGSAHSLVVAGTDAGYARTPDAGAPAAGAGAQGEERSSAASTWKQLSLEIEELRRALAAMVRSRADLQRDEVLELSRRLDQLVVKAQYALAAEPPVGP